jgi:aspartokinase
VGPLKYRDVGSVVGQVLASRGVETTVNAGDFALVSVVGEALRQRLEVWAREADKALAKGGVEVHGTSQDEISLSYLVPEAHRKKAVTLLHKQLVQ